MRYTWQMIKSFRHGGIERFFKTGSKAGIQPAHAGKLASLLSTLDYVKAPEEMNLPGFGMHRLTGNLQGHWSVKVNGNWRVTFTFEGEDAILVDYLDYH
ncbi:MAG: type II toxin-antitoxin system RelE/ParE family toxin [Terracidiphilus sp.]|jgi:proteic killer suppression protein